MVSSLASQSGVMTNDRASAASFPLQGSDLESQSSFSGEEKPSNVTDRTGISRLLSQRAGYLDSRAVLKAFRLIGGYAGIHIEELRQSILTVRSDAIRKPLLNNLDVIFRKFDNGDRGYIDVMDFERMVNSSTLLQQAIYDILARVDEDEAEGFAHTQERPMFIVLREYMEIASLGLVLLNFLSVALALDNSPDWKGWDFVELFFLCMFSCDIGIRFGRLRVRTRLARSPSIAARSSSSITVYGVASIMKPLRSLGSTTSSLPDCQCSTWPLRIKIFLASPFNVADVIATLFGWLELNLRFSEYHIFSQHIFLSLRLLRWIRLVRLLRLVNSISHFRDLGLFLMGIATGTRVVLFSLIGITTLVLMWAIVIRQDLVHQQEFNSDEKLALEEIFPNVPRSAHVLFRCMVLQSDGACTSKHGSIVELLSSQMGGVFDALWLGTEVFTLFVVYNAIVAIFVCQGAENAEQLKEIIHHTVLYDGEESLQKLDKLLRTLIYPGREKEQANPKDRYAAEVASIIRNDYPEAAANISNLEGEVVKFARCINESKNMLQNAMNGYEANEVGPCKDLQNTPSATMHSFEGQELLLVNQSDASISNSLCIPSAPMSAVEVILMQDSVQLGDLVEEAKEVQSFVKSRFYPHSSWAATEAAGYSGDIRNISCGLCDEALDPGTKSISRIEQKVATKYNGRYQRNRDYCRLGLIFNSVKSLMQALPQILSLRLSYEGMEVVQIENRFVHPHSLGWRDITILLRVVVPSSGKRHIMELQLMLRGLTECRNENHKFYEQIRGLLPQDVLVTILDRLVTDTTLELGITRTEWSQCLHNKEVKRLLDTLGVPPKCRKRLFELVDIDDSGRVASSELQEILRFYNSPTQALELVGCHQRVREVQRHAQTKLGPRVEKLQKHVQSIGSSLEGTLKELVHHLPQIAKDIPKDGRCKPQLKVASSSLVGGVTSAKLPVHQRQMPGRLGNAQICQPATRIFK